MAESRGASTTGRHARRRLAQLAGPAVSAASFAGLLAGCGAGTGFVIDHSVVENAIEVSIAQQQHVLTIVTCPAGITAARGNRFQCTVTFANGSQAPVTVTEIDDKGNVRYTGLRGYVNGRKAT